MNIAIFRATLLLAAFAVSIYARHKSRSIDARSGSTREQNEIVRTDSGSFANETVENISLDKYPIIIPANLVMRICVKDTMLEEKLDNSANECGDDYRCVLSKSLEGNQTMDSLAALLKLRSTGKVGESFKQGMRDCRIWWRLRKRFGKDAGSPYELASCLFQAFSLRCKGTILDRVKARLVGRRQSRAK